VRFSGPFSTPAEVEPRLRERTLTVNGVSKGYSMTGWRIGYAGGPAWLVRAMQILQSQSTSNPSTISQAATVAALRGGLSFLDDWLVELRANRDLVNATIARCAGLHCEPADGAFYAFVNCAGLIGATTPDGTILRDDLAVATWLLESAHVGVVHGSAFGVEDHVRIAYAVPVETLKEACRRIEAACATLTLAPLEAGA
jgi:aspartate aminotransferase